MINLLITNYKEFTHVLLKCEVNIAHIKFANAFNDIKSILLYK